MESSESEHMEEIENQTGPSRLKGLIFEIWETVKYVTKYFLLPMVLAALLGFYIFKSVFYFIEIAESTNPVNASCKGITVPAEWKCASVVLDDHFMRLDFVKPFFVMIENGITIEQKVDKTEGKVVRSVFKNGKLLKTIQVDRDRSYSDPASYRLFPSEKGMVLLAKPTEEEISMKVLGRNLSFNVVDTIETAMGTKIDILYERAKSKSDWK